MIIPYRDRRPAPAQSDDGNAWHVGPCWLCPDHRYTAVLWLGPVIAVGHVEAPLYACEGCIARLNDMVWDYTDAAEDSPTMPDGRRVPLYLPRGAEQPRTSGHGRHRRPRTPLGRQLRDLVAARPRTDAPQTSAPCRGGHMNGSPAPVHPLGRGADPSPATASG